MFENLARRLKGVPRQKRVYFFLCGQDAHGVGVSGTVTSPEHLHVGSVVSPRGLILRTRHWPVKLLLRRRQTRPISPPVLGKGSPALPALQRLHKGKTPCFPPLLQEGKLRKVVRWSSLLLEDEGPRKSFFSSVKNLFFSVKSPKS